MGFSGISPWSLLLILVIVLVIFGTKKLRNAGGDLGGAIKNFKKAMSDAGKEETGKDTPQVSRQDGNVIDSEAKTKSEDKV